MSAPRESYLSQKPHRSHRRSGFTLIELLVVMALLTLISGVLIALVKHSSALVSKGTQTIALNQKIRNTLDKIQPYLLTAVANAGSPALNTPPVQRTDPLSDSEKEAYESIQFTTTEDFLPPDSYDPVNESWVATSGAVFYYEIFFDKTSNPVQYNFEDGRPPVNLGRVMLRKCDANFNPDPNVDPKPLGFNLMNFYAHRKDNDSLEVFAYSVGKRKGPAGNQVDVFEQGKTVVTIPSVSYR